MNVDQLWAMLILHGAKVFIFYGTKTIPYVAMQDGSTIRFIEEWAVCGELFRLPGDDIHERDVDTLYRYHPEWYASITKGDVECLLGHEL